jgi:hypothetical protein
LISSFLELLKTYINRRYKFPFGNFFLAEAVWTAKKNR